MKLFLIFFLTTLVQGCNAGASAQKNQQASTSNSLAGVVNGGGGKGIRCGNTVRTLDLYEAELKGYPTPITSGDFEVDLKTYMYKISRQLSAPQVNVDDPAKIEHDLKTARKMLNEVIDLPWGEKLDFTNDATLPQLPTGCSFVQIAVNVVSEEVSPYVIKIHRDKELWNLMSPVDQVALAMHEFTYASIRILQGEINSDDTRTLIARMFTGLDTQELYTPIRNNKSLVECYFFKVNQPVNSTDFSKFYAASEVENGVSGLGIYFSAIKNKVFTTRTRSFIPDLTPNDLVNFNNGNLKLLVVNQLLDRKWSMELKASPAAPGRILMGIKDFSQNSPSDFISGYCKHSE